MTKDSRAWNDLLRLITQRRQLPMAGYLLPYAEQSLAVRLAIDTLWRLGIIDEFEPGKWREEWWRENQPPRPLL